MKKFLLLMLLCVCFIFTGCSYGEVGLVRNADGTVVEYYYIPFPETQLLAAGATSSQLNTILANIKADYESKTGIISQLINDYQTRISSSTNYSLEQKAALISGVTYEFGLLRNDDGYCTAMQYIFNFANTTCYLEFKEANGYIKEDKEIIETNNFFTTVTKTVKDPLFDKISNGAITVGINCLKQVEKHMQTVLGSQWETVKYYTEYEKYSSKFNYTYVVPTSRLHSNATSITRKSNGYYYHTWQIDANNITLENPIKIEYWTVSANKPVWYVLAFLICGIVIGYVYLKGKKQEKEEAKKFKLD